MSRVINVKVRITEEGNPELFAYIDQATREYRAERLRNMALTGLLYSGNERPPAPPTQQAALSSSGAVQPSSGFKKTLGIKPPA